jgi:hypothetical protein
MPVRDYRAYALSPKGKAARARAYARRVAIERENKSQPAPFNTAPLVQALTNWRNA